MCVICLNLPITELQRLEGTSENHRIQPPVQTGPLNKLRKKAFRCIVSISREWDFITSQGSLFYCSLILTILPRQVEIAVFQFVPFAPGLSAFPHEGDTQALILSIALMLTNKTLQMLIVFFCHCASAIQHNFNWKLWRQHHGGHVVKSYKGGQVAGEKCTLSDWMCQENKHVFQASTQAFLATVLFVCHTDGVCVSSELMQKLGKQCPALFSLFVEYLLLLKQPKWIAGCSRTLLFRDCQVEVIEV